MNDDDLGQTVRFREFVASRDEIRARIHAIELEQARLSSALMHVPAKLEDLAKSVQALTQQLASSQQQPASEADHTILALHRALDKTGGGAGTLERLLLLGMTALSSFFVARLFIGG